MMNIFKKSRSRSPSFEIPKLCLPRQKRSTSMDSSSVVLTSLDVPNEVRGRSSSFDSGRLRVSSIDLLQVPTVSVTKSTGHRSHSFDSAMAPWSPVSSDDNWSDKESSNNLKLPKYQTRRASLEIPKICMHCVHLETLEQERAKEQIQRANGPLFYLGDTQTSSDASLSSSTSGSDPESDGSYFSDSERSESGAEIEIIETLYQGTSPQHSHGSSPTKSYTDVVTLAVPVIKQRSSSMDAGHIAKPPESPRKASLDERCLHNPQKQIRSQSVDSTIDVHKEVTQFSILANIQQSFR